MDCHVLLENGALKKLLDYYDSGKDEGNLLHGPLLYDDLKSYSTPISVVVKRDDVSGNIIRVDSKNAINITPNANSTGVLKIIIKKYATMGSNTS